ncbi:MAG TPA: efflux RND transporter periplasmic adaptor subunit, partial [Anaerolineae bacterium]|nr:efflux RND transporter periplasmic adaptor subunit [Anaerolineae bacterium]
IDATEYEQALDQAKGDLQEAEEYVIDLDTPPSELDVAEADLAVARAELKLAQARQNLEDLQEADDSGLESSVLDALDNLDQVRLQAKLEQIGNWAKRERDLLYSIDWHDRRINELELLISDGKANLEQVEELSAQRDSLAEARADLQALYDERDLSLQVAAAEVAAAEAEVAEAQEAVAEAQLGAGALDLAKAELPIREAEVAAVEAKEKRSELDLGADPIVRAAAQASLDKKRLAVADAVEDLAATTLRAPFDGTILSAGAKQGQLINKNSEILTIANLDHLRVRAAVDETTVRQVEVGQRAVITFDAFPGQQFRGEVLSIPLQGSLQGDVMVYEVPVSLQGAEELPLLVGMTANVAIQVGQVSDALLVPAMALQNIGGLYQVLVPGSDPEAEPQAVPVEVGLSNGTYAQIVRGLNEGDQVVMQLQDSQSAQFGFGGMGMGFIREISGGRR